MIAKTIITNLHRDPIDGDIVRYIVGKDPFYTIFNSVEHNLAFFIPKQLLVVRDETPNKIGDWYIDDTNTIRQTVTEDEEYWKARPDYKKIIAAYPTLAGAYSQKSYSKDLCPITTGECNDNTECLAYGIKECELKVAKIDRAFVEKYLSAGRPELIKVAKSYHFKTDTPPVSELALDKNDCIIASIIGKPETDNLTPTELFKTDLGFKINCVKSNSTPQGEALLLLNPKDMDVLIDKFNQKESKVKHTVKDLVKKTFGEEASEDETIVSFYEEVFKFEAEEYLAEKSKHCFSCKKDFKTCGLMFLDECYEPQQENEAEKTFDENAKKHMKSWNIEDFKKSHPSLFKAIIESIKNK